MTQLKEILEAYRDNKREFPSYGELMALAENVVPAGFAVLPLEPTDEMYFAACHAFHAWRFTTTEQPDFTHRDAYRAMVSKAPALPAAKGD